MARTGARTAPAARRAKASSSAARSGNTTAASAPLHPSPERGGWSAVGRPVWGEEDSIAIDHSRAIAYVESDPASLRSATLPFQGRDKNAHPTSLHRHHDLAEMPAV